MGLLSPSLRSRALIAGGACALALGLGGCASPPLPPPSNVELPFDQAVAAASDHLVAQAKRLAALQGSAGVPVVVVAEPVVEARSGQRTAATGRADSLVVERLGLGLGTARVVPLDSAALPGARFLLVGAFTRALGDRPKGTVLINLALVALPGGAVVAQSWALARLEGMDATPLPCDADAPIRLRDPRVEALLTTSATGAGQPAQALVVERLAAAAAIAEADRLCNAGRPAEALARYKRAAAEPGGNAPRVLNGLYVTSSRLGRTAEAEQAFDRLVAAGLASRDFEVKFLFNPGGTVLIQDARYPMWLRRISRATAGTKVCLQVIGHAGNAASPAAAESLALQRAAFVRQRLIGEASVLGSRTTALGAGSGQTRVDGSTDNAVDVLDRRIGFRTVACG